MGKGIKLKLLAAASIILLVVLGICYWYMMYYTKTPEYALKMIERSIDRHDQDLFAEYVNLDEVLDGSYDEMVAGLMDAESVSEDVQDTAKNLANLLKAPMITSLKAATLKYVATGTWEENEKDVSHSLDADEVLTHTGIKTTSYKGVDGIETEGDLARAYVRVYQSEAGEDFVFTILFRQNSNGGWQAVEAPNFQDFIIFVTKARQAELASYLTASDEIISRHNKTVQDADFDFHRILAGGSLGNDETRSNLKAFMYDVVRKDWQERKQELEALTVPGEAQSLQHLRIKIAELHIEYAEGYADWMVDKKAATIREADRKLRQAKILEQEERILLKRMNARVYP